VLTVGAIAACSSSDNNGTPGGAGTSAAGSHSGGSSGSGTAGTGTAGTGTAGTGTAGTGTAGTGTAGTGTAGTGGASAGFACANTMPTAALITDFSNLVASTTSTGNYTFMGGVLGGTYSYQPNALTLDTVGNTALNVKGNVKNYDGFGLYFNTCYDAKTLGYTGISFSIKGYAGPKGTVNFRIATNANTAYNDPVNTAAMKGQCLATNPADTYPDCHAAGFDIPVTSTATVVNVNFSQLMGGLPSNGVTGADIVGIEWALDWTPGATGTAGSGAGGASGGSGGASAGAGGASAGSGGASAGAGGKGGSGGASAGSGGAVAMGGPYDANITIDDVKFIGGPPAGGAGGASSGGSGGASAGSGGASGGSGGKAGSGGASGGSGGKAGSGG